MKKETVLFAVGAVCVIGLCGCGGRASERDVFIMTNPAEAAVSDMQKTEQDTGEEAAKQETEGNVQEDAEETAQDAGLQETEDDGTAGGYSGEPFRVNNPGGEYYYEGGEAVSNPQTLTLTKISEKANQIIDEEAWLTENDLTRPGFPYEDDRYRYEVYGDNGFDVYLLKLYDKNTGELTADLDFTDYRYANDFAPEDAGFVGQRICYARAKDGVLYVATAHNTYAGSSPHTAYVTAVDLTDFHVIWKTEPLMCNAYSFEILCDALVCGYGFTAEDDFLNIIDLGTGKLWEQIPIKSMASYIIWKDDTLYVRTYDTDYMFSAEIEDGGSEKQK